MTKEEILETLVRIARDKVAGSQGVIILVAQDGPGGTDMTAGLVNMEAPGAATCLNALLKRTEKRETNGIIIVPGRQ